jgi:hypothetical protein
MGIAQFSLREAQLFRMLAALFGEDNVIPHLTLAVVLGEVQLDAETRAWCAQQRCLITVVGRDDEPRFVLDFEAIEGDIVDPLRVELHGRGRELLTQHGVFFFSIASDDFEALTTPGTGYTLIHFFDEQFARAGVELQLLDE